MADQDAQTVILVLKGERDVIPVSTAAFKVLQGPRNKAAEYDGALVIAKSGDVSEIRQIKIIGLYGSPIWRKALSALTCTWSISTTLVSKDMSLSEIKYLLISNLSADYFDFEAEELPALVAGIEAQNSVSGLFRTLAIPPPDEVLDVL